MRKIFTAALAAAAIALTFQAQAAGNCTTIQRGVLTYQSGALAGQLLQVGVDPYGYNYQAHSFAGNYFNAYANPAGFPPYDGDDAAYLLANPTAAGHWAWQYRAVEVAMKWNDGWLANTDCDGDGKLDRHLGFASYVGSGAWLTNHNSWTVTVDGQDKRGSEFLKVVAAPTGSTVALPVSYFGEKTIYVDGKVMGPQLWGEFAAVQYVLNDSSTGDNGLLFKGELNAGFGN
ncbi:MAG: hypothetical protein Q7S95_00055 [bacterium]|nr:hypothetical protein [bacterium]